MKRALCRFNRVVLMMILVVGALVGSQADASLRVMATGDSHTYRYSGLSFGYGTLVRWTYHDEATQLRAYYSGVRTQQYIDDGRINEVLAADPDIIQFLLGTNDSTGQVSVETYSSNVTTILNAFTSFTNGRGNHPVVVVSTVMPLIDPEYTDVATPYIESYNAWLRELSVLRDDFVLIDYDASLTSIDGWESYYTDGVHLDGAMTQYQDYGLYPAGYILLAEQFHDAAIAAIPEPGSLIALAVILWVAFMPGCRRRVDVPLGKVGKRA